jgi:hypothetical protein
VADSLLPASADYTDKDFASSRRRLNALIASVFPTWNDTSVADFGNILVEMFAWCMDVLGFYQDNNALESRIVTAVQRKNLLALSKLINYEPGSAHAAQCLVRFTCTPPPPVNDPVILGVGGGNPFPIVVKAGDEAFELQHTITLTSANPTVWGTVENSETHLETFASSGVLGQEIALARTPYLDGSAIVTADNGGYTEVETFVNSTAVDKHFTLQVNNVDVATIRFGNQVNGQLPSGTIIVSYKTGGGSKGNVEPNSITQISGPFQTNSGLPATVNVLNASARATGGTDRESEAQIKENGPLSLRVLTRAVGREDFEILSTKPQVGGMARALLLTNVEDGNIPLNTGHLYMVPPANRGVQVGFPTPARMDQVLRRIRRDYPWPPTFDVQLKMVTFLDLNFYARVYLRKGYSHAQVAEQAWTSFMDYFSLYRADGSTNERITFGYYYETSAADNVRVVPLSDMQNVVRDCPGIQRLGVNPEDFTVTATTSDNTGAVAIRLASGSHADIPILKQEFPRFNSVVLIDGATGGQFWP